MEKDWMWIIKLDISTLVSNIPWAINCMALLENLDCSRWKKKQGTDNPMNTGTLLLYISALWKVSWRFYEHIKYHPIFMLPWGSLTWRMRKEDEDTKRGRKWKADQCKWGLHKFIFGTARAWLSLRPFKNLDSVVLIQKRFKFRIQMNCLGEHSQFPKTHMGKLQPRS